MKSAFAAAFALVAFAGSALAQDITTVNGYTVQARVFNDFASSILTYGPAGAPAIPAPVPGNFPLPGFTTGLEFNEIFPQGIPGNFANKHQGLFSNNAGASPFGLNNSQSFTVDTSVRITATPAAPRKEAGMVFYNDRSGGFIDEGRVLVASDNGEVAVFGANMNFTGFGPNTYTVGTTAHITFSYFAPGTVGAVAAYRLIFTDSVTGVHNSGIVSFDPANITGPSAANGFNNGSTLGFVDQSQRNPQLTNSVDIVYGDVHVVPAPGAAALLGLAGLAGFRRRR